MQLDWRFVERLMGSYRKTQELYFKFKLGENCSERGTGGPHREQEGPSGAFTQKGVAKAWPQGRARM